MMQQEYRSSAIKWESISRYSESTTPRASKTSCCWWNKRSIFHAQGLVFGERHRLWSERGGNAGKDPPHNLTQSHDEATGVTIRLEPHNRTSDGETQSSRSIRFGLGMAKAHDVLHPVFRSPKVNRNPKPGKVALRRHRENEPPRWKTIGVSQGQFVAKCPSKRKAKRD